MAREIPDFDQLQAARKYRVTIRMEPLTAPVGEDMGGPFTVIMEEAHAIFSARQKRPEAENLFDTLIAPWPSAVALDFHFQPPAGFSIKMDRQADDA